LLSYFGESGERGFMWKRLKVILVTFRSSVRNQRELALEKLALRQQLATLKFRDPGQI
jgi:hypothetical protein